MGLKENNNENNKIEEIETTKEVIDLNDLKTNTSIDSSAFMSEMDLNMSESDLQFQEEIEKLDIPEDTIIIEKKEEKKPQKSFKEKIKNLKEKWHNLSKKKKIIIIASIVILLILITTLLCILPKKKIEEPKEEVPDVIVEVDNYRYENGVLHFLDNEEDLGTYNCENASEKLCYVAYVTNDDDFDELKKINEDDEEIIPIRSEIYNNRFVFVYDNKKETDGIIKLYDIKNKEVLKEVKQIKTYDKHENLVVLKNDKNKYGIINFTKTESKELIPFEYDNLGIFVTDNNLERISAKKNNEYYLINDKNELVTNAINERIVGANAKHLKTRSTDGTYNAYTYSGTNVGTGDYIELLDNYLAYVNNNKLYLADYEKHPMNIEGYSLHTTDYVPIAIYKNKRLSKTKNSFDIELYDNTVTIKIYDENGDSETKSLNLLEGKFSKTLANMNYFDGVLYFYQDEAKQTLLGKYTCENKNNILTDTKTLDNCYLANEALYNETTGNNKEKNYKDLLGTIPLFNKRYVFIKDGNETINLYDLTSNAKKATYKNVDTRSYTKEQKLTFVDTNNIYYIAESKRSGKFGVAKITLDKIEVQIEFKYDSILKLGDYYVLKDDKGYYLADIGGKILTDAKEWPIVDYNLNNLKTYKNNEYKVSGFKEQETNTTFEYVELYEKYYATVKNKLLSIYKYGLEEPVIDNIKLELTNYNDDEKTKAFLITFENNYALIKIGEKNNTYKNLGKMELKEKVKQEEEKKEENSEVEEGTENDKQE